MTTFRMRSDQRDFFVIVTSWSAESHCTSLRSSCWKFLQRWNYRGRSTALGRASTPHCSSPCNLLMHSDWLTTHWCPTGLRQDWLVKFKGYYSERVLYCPVCPNWTRDKSGQTWSTWFQSTFIGPDWWQWKLQLLKELLSWKMEVNRPQIVFKFSGLFIIYLLKLCYSYFFKFFDLNYDKSFFVNDPFSPNNSWLIQWGGLIKALQVFSNQVGLAEFFIIAKLPYNYFQTSFRIYKISYLNLILVCSYFSFYEYQAD